MNVFALHLFDAPQNKFSLSSKGFRNFTSIASPEPFCTKTSLIFIDVATALIIFVFLLWCNKQIFDLFDLITLNIHLTTSIHIALRIHITWSIPITSNIHLTMCIHITWSTRYRGGIQLPLKRLPDSSFSTLIRAGWRHEGHPVTNNFFQHSHG